MAFTYAGIAIVANSAALTLDTYGHLLRDDLGPHLDLAF
jgi:hypothetical protein